MTMPQRNLWIMNMSFWNFTITAKKKTKASHLDNYQLLFHDHVTMSTIIHRVLDAVSSMFCVLDVTSLCQSSL